MLCLLESLKREIELEPSRAELPGVIALALIVGIHPQLEVCCVANIPSAAMRFTLYNISVIHRIPHRVHPACHP